MIDIVISASLALVMFVVGLDITVKEFKEVLIRPKALLFGLILQMLFLPSVAFSISFLLSINQWTKIGLVLLALCPGGTTSNFLCYLLGLRTSLSIALTSINSFLILISLPVGIDLASSFFLYEFQNEGFPMDEFVLPVFWVILLPTAVGSWFNYKFGEHSQVIRKVLKALTVVMFIMGYLVKFFADVDNGGSGIVLEDVFSILPLTILLHLCSFGGALLLAIKMRLAKVDALTLAIEVGLQNTPLALVVSALLVGGDALAKPALVYSLFSFPLTLVIGWLLKKKLKIGSDNQ